MWTTKSISMASSTRRSRRHQVRGLSAPARRVEADDEQPERERDLPAERRGHEEGEHARAGGGRDEVGEAVDEVERSLQREEPADHARKEGRPRDQRAERDAEAAEEGEGDREATLEQPERQICRGLALRRRVRREVGGLPQDRQRRVVREQADALDRRADEAEKQHQRGRLAVDETEQVV